MQPSGSFKIRGIGHWCSHAVKHGATEFVTSSGGNAGMAVAYAGRRLGVPVTVVVPSTTPFFVVDRLKEEGAHVLVTGSVWDEANEAALELTKTRSATTTFIHPFDHELLWQGHASLVDELAADLPHNVKPAAIVCSVGGGGLLNGLVYGLRRNRDWADVPVLATETEGASCFYQAVQAGAPVTLAGITSVAKSLGALRVSTRSLELAREHTIYPILVSDANALGACAHFLDDHRMLVEPACGAALAVIYEQIARKALPQLTPESVVVVVVCGGQLVTPALLQQWRCVL